MQTDLEGQQQPPSFAKYLPSRFQTVIWSLLDAGLARSAVFYAERYYAMDRSNHDARHLYAEALLRCGQTHSAMAAVNTAMDMKCSGCSEVRAKCCAALGRHRQEREELEDCLSDSAYLTSASARTRDAKCFPAEHVLHCRAGFAAQKGNLSEKAAQSFRQSLELEPLLWEAFEGLCAVGVFPEIEELFPTRPEPVKQGPTEDAFSNGASSSKTATQVTGIGIFSPDPFREWRPDPAPPQPFRIEPLMGRESIATNESSFNHDNSMVQTRLRSSRIPPVAPAMISRPLSSADESGPAPKKARSTSRPAEEMKLKQRIPVGTNSRVKKPVVTTKNEAVIPPLAARRSKRLLKDPEGKESYIKHLPTRERRRPNHTRTRSTESEQDDEHHILSDPAYSPSPPSVAQSPRSDDSPVPEIWTAEKEQAALETYNIALADKYIYDLMRLFASAHRAFAMYDCLTCLEEINKIPAIHQRSPWVMALTGRAHFEMVDYIKAERAFSAARKEEPYRLWDMEVYSTLLWHLQQNVQLSYLAQELLNIDPQSPQAWIAVGNCFSLQKERSQALTCFRRASQLDPSCAYAYTLSGHEYMDEDLEKAVSFFQSALRVDPRHYNAWYGLGTCYLRMSKIRLAEYHYRKATQIHPNNAVLLGCVGMAVERRGDRDGAFALYDEAVRLAPDNALVRYRRAKLLIGMRKFEAAASDLERLRDVSPEESNVVFQLARVYRLMGNETKAAQTLAIARDMSPKSLTKIKKLLESKEEPNDEMDEG